MKICAAVDLGASNLRVAKISDDGEILAFEKCSVSDVSAPSEITDRIIYFIEKLFGGEKPLAIGISTAGPVDSKTGEVVHSPNMKCDRIPLVRPLQEYFGVPVSMCTDCKAAVLAETAFGTAKEAKTAVYITLSTGIGAGVYSDGKLLEGAGGNASEVGHIFVDEKYHLRCGCGGFGHWEAYAGGANIPKFFKVWCGKDASTAEIFARAEGGDSVCAAFTDELAKISARGFSSVIAAYNPDVVIFDGPIVQNHPWFVEKIAGYRELYLAAPAISVSKMNGNAPLLGAAVLALRSL